MTELENHYFVNLNPKVINDSTKDYQNELKPLGEM